jgi:M6 family metalloprotease-like protein
VRREVTRHLVRAGLLAAALCLLGRPAWAVIANPEPSDLTQPDGTRITLRLRGDEHLHWMEDMNGYPVEQAGEVWVYATHDASGALVPTTVRVGSADPAAAGVTKGGPSGEERARALRTAAEVVRPFAQPTNTRPNGVVKNLVVLCLFSDHTIARDARAPSAYDSLFNQINSTGPNAPTGSVRDFFREFSYGALTLQSTVVAWVTLPHTEAYYANNAYGFPNATAYPQNSAGMVTDALPLVDPLVNFGDFDVDNDGFVDAIDFIHSGYGGEFAGNGTNTIWSHKTSLSNAAVPVWTTQDRNGAGQLVKVDLYHTEPARHGRRSDNLATLVRAGVITHETGHFFGLPDLYDTDNSSTGIGSYCLMANSWGFDNSGTHPPHPSAWCKIQLGWESPNVDPAPGRYTLGQAEFSPGVIKITGGYPAGEYLLIENREPVGVETDMPQGGLAIWHVDEHASGAGGIAPNQKEGFPGQAGWPQNDNHYTIALEQADGLYQLERNVDPTPNVRGGDAGDLYHDIWRDAYSESTSPSSQSYQGGTIALTGTAVWNVSAAGPSMSFNASKSLWVDFNYVGPSDGTFARPYSTLAAAAAAAISGERIICKSAYGHQYPTINKPLTVVTYQGVTSIGN